MGNYLHLTPLSEIELECQAIQAFLGEKITDEMNLVTERGNMLNAYLARTSELMKDSVLHYNLSKASEIGKIIEQVVREARLSAKLQNALVDSVSAREQSIVVWTERLHKTAKAQLIWCSVLIKKATEEMKFSR